MAQVGIERDTVEVMWEVFVHLDQPELPEIPGVGAYRAGGNADTSGNLLIGEPLVTLPQQAPHRCHVPRDFGMLARAWGWWGELAAGSETIVDIGSTYPLCLGF